MKKLVRLLALALLVLIVAPQMLSVSVSAASYPLIIVDYSESSKTITKGETGQICFTIYPEYHNEKYHVYLYNSSGSVVGSAESSYYNADGSTGVRSVTITIDTAKLGLSVGTYKAEYWLSYYSFQAWHDAPNKYTYTFEVTPYNCYGAHSYDNSCDATCNVCGETRSVIHSYSGSCDTACNSCGATRTPGGTHTYSSGTDTVCNTCGFTRVVIAQDYSRIIASGICGSNLTWQLTQMGTLTISGTGNMYSYSYSSAAPWDEYKWDIKNVIISEGVTSIGNYAFFGNHMENISIPSTVTKLGEDCFFSCDGLRRVVLPAGIKTIPAAAFYDCEVLESIEIPSSVQSFGQDCFHRCSSLQYFIVPDGVKEIAYSMFWGCSSMEYVQIPKSVTSIDTFAFHECDNLSDVYYTGSSSQWQAVEVEDLDKYNEGLLYATIHYNSRVPCTTCTYGYWISTGSYYHKHTCIYCGKEERDTHSWNAGVITKYPTCAATGTKTYTCTVCGGTKTTTLEKTTEHIYDSWNEVDDSTHKRICTICSKEETAGHSWDDGKVTQQPTCAATGIKTYTCSVCDGTKTETVEKTTNHAYGACERVDENSHKHTCTLCDKTETLSHDWDAGVITLVPTLETTGLRVRTCVDCNATKTEIVPKRASGDLNGDGSVSNKDVEYLLWHTLFPESYPLDLFADFDGSGTVDNKDVEYLLWHTLFPDNYPLYAS